ncbi:MAG: AraC family transcriptional regulator [Saprospiraceae bacterium]
MSKDPYPKIYLYRRIVQAKLFIDNNFAEPINLNQIADEAYFSKFHFMRIFKMTYGKTPHQYLTSVRIEKAKLLLKEQIPIAEVCFTVGFNSVSSFTGLFKRITSMAPSTYQQQQVQRNKDIEAMPLKFIPNCFAESRKWIKIKNSNFQEAS